MAASYGSWDWWRLLHFISSK